MYSGLTNELGVRKESEMGLNLLSGDENMCIVDTDSKIQEEECRKVIKIHLSLMQGHVENNHSICPTHLGVESEISQHLEIRMGNLYISKRIGYVRFSLNHGLILIPKVKP